jgi:hypothetical protein
MHGSMGGGWKRGRNATAPAAYPTVQERLFRWRYPDWQDWDPDAENQVAS